VCLKDEKKGILILKMMTLELHYRQMEPVFEPLAEEIIKILGITARAGLQLAVGSGSETTLAKNSSKQALINRFAWS
jgi:hypothetical protein